MARKKFELQRGLVLFAGNKKRVSAFDRQTLGLLAVESGASHDLLRGTTYGIVVHAIPRQIAAGITISRPPASREQAILKPTFGVKSLDDMRAAAARTGGSLQPAPEAWHFRGHKVMDGCDPEGNLVQFKQRDD